MKHDLCQHSPWVVVTFVRYFSMITTWLSNSSSRFIHKSIALFRDYRHILAIIYCHYYLFGTSAHAHMIITVAPSASNPLSPRAITLTLLAILRTFIILTAFTCGIYLLIRRLLLVRWIKIADTAKDIGAGTISIASTCLLLSTVGETSNVMALLHSCYSLTSGQASSCLAPDAWMITTGAITESLIRVALPLNVSTISLLLFVCFPVLILQRYHYFECNRLALLPTRSALIAPGTMMGKEDRVLVDHSSIYDLTFSIDKNGKLHGEEHATMQWVKPVKNTNAIANNTESNHGSDNASVHSHSHSLPASSPCAPGMIYAGEIPTRQESIPIDDDSSNRGMTGIEQHRYSGIFMTDANHTFSADVSHFPNIDADGSIIQIVNDIELDPTPPINGYPYTNEGILDNDNDSSYETVNSNAASSFISYNSGSHQVSRRNSNSSLFDLPRPSTPRDSLFM